MASLGLTYEPPAEASRGADAFRGAPASLALDPPIDELVMFGGGVPNVNAEPGTHLGARSFHGSFFSDASGGSGNARGGFAKNADAPRADASLENRRFLPVGTKQMLAHEVRLETIRLAERSMHGPGTPPSAAEKPLRSVDENKDVAKRRLATAMGGLGPTASKKAKQRRVGGGVSYKHNEGFTNAVRRPVYLRDLV
jgi:chromosome transmission fidelity protein 18